MNLMITAILALGILSNTVTEYVPSDLDNNTPVYGSDTELYYDVPSSFNTIEEVKSRYPDTRNQNPYGTCWAVSSIGLAEFDLINDGYADRNIDLSELQLAYFTFNSVVDPLGGTEGDSAKYYNENATANYLNYGGNYAMASRRLAQWVGAVNESDVPYSKAADVLVNGLDDEYAYKGNVAHLQNAYMINIKQNPTDVKQQIMEHGAVGIMYYHNSFNVSTGPNGDDCNYYDTALSGGSHAVMVVGWDDNYSKDNFMWNQPANDGAWLVRNSWGRDTDYFWMSYETYSLSDTAWAFDFSADDGFDNNYQIDGGLDVYPSAQYSTMANVFTAKNDADVESETLKAVSVSFTKYTSVNYTIEVYTDLTDVKNPTSGTRQDSAVTQGTTAYAGIYTIELADEVEIQPGSSFAIVVSVDKYALDYEQATTIATGDKLDIIVWDCKVSLNNQKTFYKSGGRFYAFPWGNLCVKAFTSDNLKNDTPDIPVTPGKPDDSNPDKGNNTDSVSDADTIIGIMEAKVNPGQASFEVPLYIVAAAVKGSDELICPTGYGIKNTGSREMGVVKFSIERLNTTEHGGWKIAAPGSVVREAKTMTLTIGDIGMPALDDNKMYADIDIKASDNVFYDAAGARYKQIEVNGILDLPLSGTVDGSRVISDVKAVPQFKVTYTVSALDENGQPIGNVYVGNNKAAAFPE